MASRGGDIGYPDPLGRAPVPARGAERFAGFLSMVRQQRGAFVDVLGEVSERTSLSSNSDVLRLYERWLRTRSRRSGDLLAARGIVPNASIGSRFIQ